MEAREEAKEEEEAEDREIHREVPVSKKVKNCLLNLRGNQIASESEREAAGGRRISHRW